MRLWVNDLYLMNLKRLRVQPWAAHTDTKWTYFKLSRCNTSFNAEICDNTLEQWHQGPWIIKKRKQDNVLQFTYICHHHSVSGERFGYAVAFNYSNILNMIKSTFMDLKSGEKKIDGCFDQNHHMNAAVITRCCWTCWTTLRLSVNLNTVALLEFTGQQTFPSRLKLGIPSAAS